MIDLTSIATLLHEHKEAAGWIAAFSMAVFVGSVVAVPWVVVRIPEDYFATKHRPKTRFAFEHPLLRSAVWTLRNLLGVSLILAGIAMLLLPGQGLLTLAVGVFLMDFPGKHRFERGIIQIRPVRKSINWLRRKASVRPLKLKSDDEMGSIPESRGPD